MEELTIEEKAKRYDKAIKVLHKYDGANIMFSQSLKEEMFPELKESEEEKTKRLLHSILSKMSFHLRDIFTEEEYQCFDAWSYAWLKKQTPNVNKEYWRGYREGKQEILDKYAELEKQEVRKVKPKFQNGQWIVLKNKWYKVNYNGCGYELIDQNDLKTTLDYETVDKSAHLWSIQDAKNGDVLASKDGEDILIFRRLDATSSFSSYYNLKGRGELGWTSTNFIPATKEQRDLLFQKMKESGYEWDAEKKELKKITVDNE